MTVNISAYMSSIRPYRWKAIDEMLKNSRLSYEIVIVGPVEPVESLPSNVSFYKSDVKPNQCFHTAAVYSKGETLLQIVDDIEYEDGGIYSMFDEVSKSDNIMATCHYHLNGKSQITKNNIAGNDQLLCHLPTLPVCGLFTREAYFQHLSLDRRFNGVMGELDLYMRLRVNGYTTKIVDYYCNESQSYQKQEKTSLCQKYWNHDRPLFVKLWTTNLREGSCLYPIRQDIVRPFKNTLLLDVEQNI